MQFLFRRRRQSVTSVSFSFKRADKSKVNPYCWKMSSHFLFTTSKEIEKLKVKVKNNVRIDWGKRQAVFQLLNHSFWCVILPIHDLLHSLFHSPNPGPEMHRIFKLIFALHVLQCGFFFSHCSEMRSVPMCIFVKRVIHFGCCEVLLRPFSSVEALLPWIIWISAGGDEARATF